MKRRWPRVLARRSPPCSSLARRRRRGAYLDARLRASLPLARGRAAARRARRPGARRARRARRAGRSAARAASTSPAPRASCTRRSASSRWTCCAGARPASSPSSSGAAALAADREVRVLQLRAVRRGARSTRCRRTSARCSTPTPRASTPASRRSRAPPFEYLLLRSRPAPWRPEDTLLCALTMYLTLQGELPGQESTLGLMHDVLPPAAVRVPRAARAPSGTRRSRARRSCSRRSPGPRSSTCAGGDAGSSPASRLRRPVELADRCGGSALAPTSEPLASAATTGRSRGVAHEGRRGARRERHAPRPRRCRTPGTAPRSSIEADGAASGRVTGVTLPGAPFVVAGSNGRVAWGFTNSEGDWADLVVLEADPNDADAYRTAAGARGGSSTRRETIRVEGRRRRAARGAADDLGARGRQGPRGPPPRARLGGAARRRAQRGAGAHGGRRRASREAQAIAPGVRHPEPELHRRATPTATSAGRSSAASRAASGTTAGCPCRGPTGRAAGTAGCRGEEYPRVVDPPSGRIWTANARVVDGENLRQGRLRRLRPRCAAAADPRRAAGARQGATRPTCCASSSTTARSSSRAGRRCCSELLTPEALAGTPLRAEARRSRRELGRPRRHRLGRLPRSCARFRERAADAGVRAARRAMPSRRTRASTTSARASGRGHRQWEGPLWALVTEQPRTCSTRASRAGTRSCSPRSTPCSRS